MKTLQDVIDLLYDLQGTKSVFCITDEEEARIAKALSLLEEWRDKEKNDEESVNFMKRFLEGEENAEKTKPSA